MTTSNKRGQSETTHDAFSSWRDLSARLLSTEEVARLLAVPITTLYCWRYKGTGPKAFRVGKYLRYRLDDVILWLEQCASER